MKDTTMEVVDAGGVHAEWFSRQDSDPTRVVMYLHGGGYSIGSIESHRAFLARLCVESGCRVLAVEYRLAREHRFPTPIEDSLAAYRFLLSQGIAPNRIVIAGESAGGGLTLATLLSLRDTGEPLPAAAVLLSAWLDLQANGASMHVNKEAGVRVDLEVWNDMIHAFHLFAPIVEDGRRAIARIGAFARAETA